jgi:DNA-directed RNA polymerase subunit L
MEVKIISNEKKNIEFEVDGVDQIIIRMLIERLNADKEVEFAAYKVEGFHSGPPRAVVRTKSKDALTLVLNKLETLQEDFADFRKQFKDSAK